MRGDRPGFSLVEILVAIAVTGILVAVLVPAVQRARDAAVRTQCANNLRQIGLACHQYHDTEHTFPVGMRWQGGKDPYRMASWLTQLLPYLEQQSLWAATQAAYKASPLPNRDPPHVCLGTIVPVFCCPADDRVMHIQIAERDRLAVALTSYLGVEGRDVINQDGMLFRDSHIRFQDVSDGTSNTLLAGERPPSPGFQYGWWYMGTGQRLTGSLDMVLGVQEQNLLSYAKSSCPSGPYSYEAGDPANPCDRFHFWSLHVGGAQFLLADAAVRWLGYDAEPLMAALATRAGGEAVELAQ